MWRESSLREEFAKLAPIRGGEISKYQREVYSNSKLATNNVPMNRKSQINHPAISEISALKIISKNYGVFLNAAESISHNPVGR